MPGVTGWNEGTNVPYSDSNLVPPRLRVRCVIIVINSSVNRHSIITVAAKYVCTQ